MDLEWLEPVKIVQGTARWLEWRAKGLGSSDAPVVMGVSPYLTPLQLWEEKTGIRAAKEAHQGMRRGQDLEPIARLQYEKDYFEMEPSLMVHPDYDFIRASLDGFNLGHRRILEIKCPNKADHQLALDGKVPEKYWPQLQHQLLVCPLADQVDYYSFDGVSGVRVEVKRDLDYQAALLQELRAFWQLVKKKIPPHLTDRDFVSECTEADLLNVTEWKRKKKQIEILEKDVEELKEEICKNIRHPRVRIAGVRIQRIVRKGAINYSAIPELKKIDLEAYRKPGTEYISFTEEKSDADQSEGQGLQGLQSWGQGA